MIGMNWMMRELTRMGRGDVAFLLASNKTYPSYGYMIEKELLPFGNCGTVIPPIVG